MSSDNRFSAEPTPSRGLLSEDWTAALLGLIVLALALVISLTTQPEFVTSESGEVEPASPWVSPMKAWLGKPGSWGENPIASFQGKPEKDEAGEIIAPGPWQWQTLVGAFLVVGLIGSVGVMLRGQSWPGFLIAFPVLFLLATFAYVLAGQSVIKNYNLEYALWALLTGLIISNTIGTPNWLRPAVVGELYIKIGLVLLGAGVLIGRLVALGVPGIFVSWIVTPIVLVSTYVFGQRVLKISSKSLNMVISADMSVCGVSAAIATAASCKAKKEELSLAIGLSLSFTVIMMIVMPAVVKALELDPVVGGAWIGGTIDATGAVVAAGEALGKAGSDTAVTIKMIQNILIGAVAFSVAVYWTRWVEPAEARSAGGASSQPTGRDDSLESDVAQNDSGKNEIVGTPDSVGIGEIWKRFPKFVLGFITASIVCSLIFASSAFGEAWVDATVGGMTKTLRGWLFCLAFVCIGLDTNFRQLLPYFRTGKPMVLYLCGQALNILLTFLMAYLMFGVIFKQG